MKSFVGLLAIALAPVVDEDFEKRVRPLLVERCLKCHGPEKQSGGLRLDSREALFKGGDSGPAVVSGEPEESLLIEAVAHKNVLRMPPKEKLAEGDIAALTDWVRRGLPWTEAPIAPTAKGMASDEPTKWWSFRPLRPVAPPQVGDDPWPKSEIDRFVLASLRAKNLAPAPPADKRTLLRRATYDLTGLPPTFEEAAAFLKDERPDAFAQVVERLLASTSYGERWGRHWLDLVRYADTAGENTDHPVPDAWRYRNWVVDAFNADQPYDEFVREQVAGDVLAVKGPDDRYSARVTATGFLAIARRFDHDSDKSMHLTHEDAIDVLGKAFLGLSISCARCHDHKYDPITSKDYYALYGALQSSRFAFPGCEPKQQPRDLVPLLSPAALVRRAEGQAKELADLDAESKGIAESRPAPRPLARGEVPDGGSQDIGAPLGPIEVKAGEAVWLSIAPLANHGADSTIVDWEIVEADGPGRWDLKADLIDDFAASNPASVWWLMDGRGGTKLLGDTQRDFQGNLGLHVWRNGDVPSVFVNAGAGPLQVWTKLPPRSLFAHPAPDGPVAIVWVSPISGKVFVRGRLADAHPGGPDGIGWTVDHVAGDFASLLKTGAGLDARLAQIAQRRAELGRQETAYAVVEGTPTNARVHLRGDPEKLGPEVPRRWLELFGGQLVPEDGGSGRLQLAQWLAAPENPLAPRVMANRVWQHHFGKGLVKTPNDFGTRGLLPTHPELLDWLASQFVKDGWSVKALHRRIMSSATYQQSITVRPDASAIDPNNDLYWRFDRRRLSAEEIRDALLTASGRLDRTPGGPHPFPAESTWNFTQHDPFNAFDKTNKRSVYQLTLRNRRPPFFALFDGADPNATTPQRQETTVPTQALFFLNDPVLHAQADAIAARLSGTSDSARLDDLYRIVLQRPPAPRDREAASAFLRAYANESPGAAWPALARVLLAGNEFLYVD